MIAPAVVQEVRRLLAEGKLSQRKIAALTRISRGTVARIAAEKRSDCHSRRPTREQDGPPEPTGLPERCPGCGGMVYMPCRLCHTRAAKLRSPKPPALRRLVQSDGPLELDLRGQQRERYEEVRARRASRASEPDAADRWDSAEFDDDECVLDPAELRDALEFDGEEPVINF